MPNSIISRVLRLLLLCFIAASTASAKVQMQSIETPVLTCEGESAVSEVVYWKNIPSDMAYKSPFTERDGPDKYATLAAHNGPHSPRYVTFQWDGSGLNNVKMVLETVLVIAHAMGRTLVLPPAEHIFNQNRGEELRGKHTSVVFGFDDFINMRRMHQQKGFHFITMEEFLEREGAVTGGLHGIFPPGNSTKASGDELWQYMMQVADAVPQWGPTGRGEHVIEPFLVMLDSAEQLNELQQQDSNLEQRLKVFANGRDPMFYNKTLQQARHIHFPSWPGEFRLLEHFYTYVFFPDPKVQTFYRRFVRDYIVYKESFHCAGAELLSAIRADAHKEDPSHNGDFYALHIRRGDFHIPRVMISAAEIVQNLVLPGGAPIIPRGSLVYISTDDPKGICRGCSVEGKPCTSFEAGKKPVGCPEDPSWKAFELAGWKLRFRSNYLKVMDDIHPKFHGIVESIACARAKAFAGTSCSTYTGYIHRLRGYHGLGNTSYYHTTHEVFMQLAQTQGNGWWREWPAAWTDENGQPL